MRQTRKKPNRSGWRETPATLVVLLSGIVVVGPALALLLGNGSTAHKALLVSGLFLGWLVVIVATYRDATSRAADRWLTLIVVAVFLVVLFVVRDRQGAMSFYSVAAELIPVLVLALAVQGTALRVRGVAPNAHMLRALGESMSATVVAITIMCLAVGEASALWAVFVGHPVPSGTIVAAIAAGFAGILIQAFLGPSAEESAPSERVEQ